MEIENRTQWHPAFCSTMELELMENEKGLAYDPEYYLSRSRCGLTCSLLRRNRKRLLKTKLGHFPGTQYSGV